MKILTKKQWRMIEKRIDNLNNDIFDLRYKVTNLRGEKYKLILEKEDLQVSKRKLASAKGGLNARIKRLVKQLNDLNLKYNELEEKYKESMTDKYLVKKLKPGRTPKTTSMKLKDCSRVSNITRKVISHYEKDI